MIKHGSATEAEVLLAFVKAEADASRFRKFYPLSTADRKRLIDLPDLTNEHDNGARRALLRYRGYPNARLFAGLPNDIQWQRAAFERSDFPRLKHGNYPNWMRLSGGTGHVLEGARNVDDSADQTLVERIRAVVDAVRNGKQFPELILLETDDSDLIVFEGTTRATAYAYIGVDMDLPVFVGSSTRMSQWHWFPL